MGLQIGELKDIANDSIPILLLTIIAAAIRNLRAAVFNSLHQIHTDNGNIRTTLSDFFDSGLSTLIFIAEQLNLLNIIATFSNSIELYPSCSDDNDCVVCLCPMKKRNPLRRVECGHVFHKKCLDEWLKHLHFTCPLCRFPVSTAANSKSKIDSSSFTSELIL